MCKSERKKYQNYRIIIKYNNGEKEEIDYKGINTSNYKTMLDLYRDVKNTYKNQSVSINFVGVSDEGELKIMWTKEIKGRVNSDLPILNKLDEFINIAKECSQMLKKERVHSMQLKGAYDKLRDNQWHGVENFFEQHTFADKDDLKNQIYDFFMEMYKTSIERRNAKNEIAVINSLCQKKYRINLNNIRNIEGFEQFVNHERKVLDNIQKSAPKSFVKTIDYKTQEEKDCYIKKLNNKYEKVIDDSQKCQLICYNKCKV